MNISEQDTRAFYDENKANYLTAESTQKPYAEVKAAIQEQLLTERAQAAYARALEDLSDWSYQTPDSLTDVAQKLHATIEKTNLFSRRGGDAVVTKNPEVIRAAFSRDVLELGNNSAPIQLDNESVLVLRVDKHQAAKQKSFEAVAPVIEQRVIKEKAITAAANLGDNLLHLDNAEQREKLMQMHQLAWVTVNHATRETDQVPASINELAFSLSRKPGSNNGRMLDTGHYVVVELQKVNDGEQNILDKEHLASISNQMEASDGLVDYDLYINHLLSQATIVRADSTSKTS